MLNEWSDRRPPKPPRPFYARGEFWIAVATILLGTALAAGFVSFLIG